MEFNCAKFRADGKVRDSEPEPESDEPPALVVQAPAEKLSQVGVSRIIITEKLCYFSCQEMFFIHYLLDTEK